MLQPATNNQFTEKGRALYYQLKPKLENKYPHDNVILIDVESGDYFVGDTTSTAYKKAHAKYPHKKFFIAQIGQLASLLKYVIQTT